MEKLGVKTLEADSCDEKIVGTQKERKLAAGSAK